MTAIVAQPQAKSLQQRLHIGFLLVVLHALPIWALIVGTSTVDWVFFACLYPFQCIGVGSSMHRYFAHRSYKTSRLFQFFLALTSASVFGDAVGFAGKHRLHHQFVDSEKDVHSPVHGVWACWVGSLLDNGYTEQKILEKVPDLTKYPELMWLHRWPFVPGLILCALAFAVGGLTTVGIGVCQGMLLRVEMTAIFFGLCQPPPFKRWYLTG